MRKSNISINENLCMPALIVLASLSTATQAQSLLWVDACNAPSSATEKRNPIDATVAIIDPTQLTLNVGGTSYSVSESTLTTLRGADLHADSLFYGYDIFAWSGEYRTGFLAAPNKIVTAPHQVSSFVGYKAVFGIENSAGTCIPFDPHNIPIDNVYQITHHDRPTTMDFAILTIDRPAVQNFIRLRREGLPSIGDEAAVVGHPARLPTRFDWAGTVEAVINNVVYFQKLHSIPGNSGSPVFNITDQFVETIISPDNDNCAVSSCEEEDDDGLCTLRLLFSDCPGEPFMLNGLSAKTIASYLPPTELLVKPLDTLKQAHRTGPITDPVTTYTLTAPKHPEASATIDYEIVPSAAPPLGEPWLSIASGTPLVGTLTAGDQLVFDVTTMKPTSPPSCQTYERSFKIIDKTHNLTDVVRQRIEIGYNGFTINGGSTAPLMLEGIEIPYRDETDLAVHNPYLTAIAVRIEANQPWLRIDTIEGTVLAPAVHNIIVNPGETRNIPIGLSPVANSLTADGETAYSAQLSVSAFGTSCTLTPPGSVGVTFTPGRLSITQPINAQVPPAVGGSPGTPLTSSIQVDENFCIDEITASYGIRMADTLPNFVANWITESSWRIARPGSLNTIPLWHRNVPPPSVFGGVQPLCISPEGSVENCYRLKRGAPDNLPTTDCSFFAPLPCEEVTDVIGTAGRGTWSTALRDHSTSGTSKQPIILEWGLTFVGHHGCAVP